MRLSYYKMDKGFCLLSSNKYKIWLKIIQKDFQTKEVTLKYPEIYSPESIAFNHFSFFFSFDIEYLLNIYTHT